VTSKYENISDLAAGKNKPNQSQLKQSEPAAIDIDDLAGDEVACFRCEQNGQW